MADVFVTESTATSLVAENGGEKKSNEEVSASVTRIAVSSPSGSLALRVAHVNIGLG